MSSNKESGDGYSDILIETEDQETGIIIEIKYAETGNLEAVSEDALKQIEDRRYEEQLLEEGVEQIMEYFKKTVSENGEALEVRYCILQKEMQSNSSQIKEFQSILLTRGILWNHVFEGLIYIRLFHLVQRGEYF